MDSLQDLSPELRTALESIYEEVMWLAGRPRVTAGRARSWYTHIMAESVKRQIRRFTGQVSRSAVSSQGVDLRLEHYKRIQTTLTGLVERHRQEQCNDPEEFVRTIFDFERVHIVTVKENYDAMRAGGDYEAAGIELISWQQIPEERRSELWLKMLRGKVSNARLFAVQSSGA